jgi:hypothetical protein
MLTGSLFNEDANNNYGIEQSASSSPEPESKEEQQQVPAKTKGKGKASAASSKKASAPTTAPKKALAAASKRGETSAKGKKKNPSAASSTKVADKPPQRGSEKTGEENRVRPGTPMDANQTSSNTTTPGTAANTTVVKAIKPHPQPKKKTKQPTIDAPAVKPGLSNSVIESQTLPPSLPLPVDAPPPVPIDTNPPLPIGSPLPLPDESPPVTPIDSPLVAPSLSPPLTPETLNLPSFAESEVDSTPLFPPNFAQFTEKTGMPLPPWQPATAKSTSGPSTSNLLNKDPWDGFAKEQSPLPPDILDDYPMHSDDDHMTLGKRTDRSPSITKNDPTGKRKLRSEAQHPHVQASAHVASILGMADQQDGFASLPVLRPPSNRGSRVNKGGRAKHC